MNKTIQYIGLLALLPLVMAALSPDFISEADAQKSEGSEGSQSPKSYGSATNDTVCGASLCSTPAGQADPVNEGKAQ